MNEDELIQRANKLIKRFDNMRIIGSRGEWSGSARQGFAFNPVRGGGSAGTGGGGGVIVTGACCLDGDCIQTTEVNCLLQGGTYQGNYTLCSSTTIDCGHETTGACCVGSNCSIETPEDCINMGGVYQGDDTTCIPDPCAMVECSCGFPAFDGSGRRFLRQERSMTSSESNASDGFGGCDCSSDSNATWSQEYDPDTCDITCDCSGSVTRTDPVHLGNNCTDSLSFCSDGFDPYSHIGTFTPQAMIGCQSLTCGSCCDYTATVATDSPTQRTFTLTGLGCCDGQTNTFTVTLSNECTPV